MTETMIERVARAMAALRNNAVRDGAVMDCYGDLARAAIAAMEEPTTEMLRALLRHRGYDPDAKEETLDALGNLDVMTMGSFTAAYRAMVKGALE